MKILKEAVIIFTVFTLCMMFSGCKSDVAENSGLKVLKWWSGAAHEKAIVTKMVDEFNNTQGKKLNVKIDYTVVTDISSQLEVAFTTNQTPDFFSGYSLKSLVQNKRIISIDELPGSKEFLEPYQEFLRENSNKYEGKTYAVPQSTLLGGLIYNKDMFKKAGLTDEKGEPLPPKTWDEVREYAKKLTDIQKKQYGIVFPLKWDDWFNHDILYAGMASAGTLGYNPVNGEYDFSGFNKIMQTVVDIKNDKSCYPGAEGLDNDPARARFAEGNIGMKLGWSWDVAVFKDQFPAKCEIGVAPFPVTDVNNRYKQFMAVYNQPYLSKGLKDKVDDNTIMEIYKWMCSKEMAVTLYKAGIYLPWSYDLVKDIKLENAPNGWSDFAKILPMSTLNAPSMPKEVSGKPQLKELFINDVWNGKRSVEDVTKEWTKTCSDGVEKYMELYPETNKDDYIDKNYDVSYK